MKMQDVPKSDRPREKLIAKGPQNLKDLPRSSPKAMVRGKNQKS